MRIIVRKIEADSILNGRKGEGTDQSEWQEQNQPIKAKNFFYEYPSDKTDRQEKLNAADNLAHNKPAHPYTQRLVQQTFHD